MEKEMYKNMDTDGYGHEDDRLNKEQGGDWNKNMNMGKGGMPSEKAALTPEKAKKMLKEDEPRSEAQEGFLGAVIGKGEKKKE